MANFCLRSLLLFSRRVSTGAAESTSKTETAIKKMGESVKKEVFWMRDPKTGNWIPESHFDQVDVAELREKLLSKNNNKF